MAAMEGHSYMGLLVASLSHVFDEILAFSGYLHKVEFRYEKLRC